MYLLSLLTPRAQAATTFQNPLSFNNVQELLTALLEGVLILGVPLIVLAVIFAGFLFATSRGNATQLTKAKNVLGYTLIGAAIILGSRLIGQLIINTFSNF